MFKRKINDASGLDFCLSKDCESSAKKLHIRQALRKRVIGYYSDSSLEIDDFWTGSFTIEILCPQYKKQLKHDIDTLMIEIITVVQDANTLIKFVAEEPDEIKNFFML